MKTEEEKSKTDPATVAQGVKKRIEDHLRECVVDCGVSHTQLVKILFGMRDAEMMAAHHIAGSTRLPLQPSAEMEG